MKRPEQITLSTEEGEAIMARLSLYAPNRSDCEILIQVMRLYFWLEFALQEAKLSVKRLRTLLFGKTSQPQETPESDAQAGSSEPLGAGASGPEPAPVAETPSAIEAAGCEAGAGESQGEAEPKPKGGHRAGTGRLGADAYVGAERVECRHEELAVGQRCPVCGQGT